MVAKKNSLEDLELEAFKEVEKRQKHRRMYPQGGRTRIAAAVRTKDRLPIPVPKNKSLSEIVDMDPESAEFRFNQGRKRTSAESDSTYWRDMIRRDKQRRTNARRARIRKYEATVIAAQKEMEKPVSESQRQLGIYDEDKALAEGILTLDDWDDEELIRGYRRARDGTFKTAPKYVPREVQVEIFRRLVSRGDRKMKQAYLDSVDELVALVRTADSEKVKLEAIKELQNRVVGKVPDRVHVATEQPYESILADSLVPISEVPALQMEIDEDGVAKLPYVDLDPLDDGADGVVASPDTTAVAAQSSPQVDAPPSVPSPAKRKSRKKVPDA